MHGCKQEYEGNGGTSKNFPDKNRVPIFDLDIEEWRSYYWDHVLAFFINGTVYTDLTTKDVSIALELS